MQARNPSPTDTSDTPDTSEPDDVDVDVARRVAELLAGRTIATAESCTAGRVAEVLACVEHANDFLRGGLVAYQEQVKREMLDVTADSVLSLAAAEQMACGAARLFGSDVAVSTTGVAGDSSEEGTPPGTVYIATFVDGRAVATEHRFTGTPVEVCDQARRQALECVVARLDQADARTAS
jgi:nicotinamide-nucleotide amidase